MRIFTELGSRFLFEVVHWTGDGTMEDFTVDPTLVYMQIPVPTYPRSLPRSVVTFGGFGLVFTAVRASIEAGNRQD